MLAEKVWARVGKGWELAGKTWLQVLVGRHWKEDSEAVMRSAEQVRLAEVVRGFEVASLEMEAMSRRVRGVTGCLCFPGQVRGETVQELMGWEGTA